MIPAQAIRRSPWALSAALALALASPATPAAHGELGSRADEPYRIRVVVHFSDDPRFTPLFVESVRRQVKDQLSTHFGALAEIDVAADHPLFAGRADPARALAELADVRAAAPGAASVDKIFLMAIDTAGAQYRIARRQVDLEVQHLGAFHEQTTADRSWLARAICLAVNDDFSPVALVELDDAADDAAANGPSGAAQTSGDRTTKNSPAGSKASAKNGPPSAARPDSGGAASEPCAGSKKVRLTFHGSARSPKWTSWIEEGCVLQPYWVVRDKEGQLLRTPIPFTVLSVEKGRGPTEAIVVSSRVLSWRKTARLAGIQAIKLTTQTGGFRLRLVNAQSGAPVLNCTVAANSKGFDSLGDADRLPDPNPEGYVVVRRSYRQLAYVAVAQGKTATFRFLLPITAPWCEVEYPIPVEPRADERSEWHRQVRYRVQDVQAIQGTIDQAIREVNALNRDKRYEDARARLREALGAIRPLIRQVREGVEVLETESRRLQLPASGLVAWTREQLQEVQSREEEMGKLEAELEAAIHDVDAAHRAKVLLRLANQAENAGEIDDAIAKYELALGEWPNQPQVQEHIDQLREAWRIKGPDHRQARVRAQAIRAGPRRGARLAAPRDASGSGPPPRGRRLPHRALSAPPRGRALPPVGRPSRSPGRPHQRG